MLEKKTYQQPEIKVVKLNGADIICTSGDLEKYNPENYNPWQ